MKILNLFAGIGGNRTLWGDKHEITAIENNQQIALIYLKRFPNDKIIITEAYEFNRRHYFEFDMIWASPPCITHTRMCAFPSFKKQYPDLRLYELIIFLGRFFEGIYVVENVIPHYSLENIDPFYKPFIIPTAIIDRHYIWSNIKVGFKEISKLPKEHNVLSAKQLCELKQVDYNLIKNIEDKLFMRKLVRNMVRPEVGKYILDSIINQKQLSLEAFK